MSPSIQNEALALGWLAIALWSPLHWVSIVAWVLTSISVALALYYGWINS